MLPINNGGIVFSLRRSLRHVRIQEIHFAGNVLMIRIYDGYGFLLFLMHHKKFLHFPLLHIVGE
jgi:hypothetical protein